MKKKSLIGLMKLGTQGVASRGAIWTIGFERNNRLMNAIKNGSEQKLRAAPVYVAVKPPVVKTAARARKMKR